MSERINKKDLERTYREVLDDFGILNKEEAQRLIDRKVEGLPKEQEAREAAKKAKAEAERLTPSTIREKFAEPIGDALIEHMDREGMDSISKTEAREALVAQVREAQRGIRKEEVSDAEYITETALRGLSKGYGVPTGEVAPSYESEASAPEGASETLLKNLYGSMEPAERESNISKSEDLSPALKTVYDSL